MFGLDSKYYVGLKTTCLTRFIRTIVKVFPLLFFVSRLEYCLSWFVCSSSWCRWWVVCSVFCNSGYSFSILFFVIQGSNMVFHALTFARFRRRYCKPKPNAAVFYTSQGTWRMLMHWKTMFGRYYCIKAENICYISRYFLHYVVLPFHRCLANIISTDYVRSRAGQYTPRNGNKSAPERLYWKLRSRALTARELPC